MEDGAVKWILISVSVVVFATLVSVMVFTFKLGTAIAGDLENQVAGIYSEAGLSMLVDADNLEDIDGANLYKILEANSNIITSYSIKNLDGSLILETNELLTRPLDRFKVNITGDSRIGFKVEVQQVQVARVGG